MSKKWLGLGIAVLLVAWLFIRHPSHDAQATEDPPASDVNVVQTKSGADEELAPALLANAAAGSEPAPGPQSSEAIRDIAAELPGDSGEIEVASLMHLIDVPLISQLPELYNGCEITSLAMLLAYLGLPADKQVLAGLLPKDETPPEFDEDGHILVWGDPDIGFVGDIFGETWGYGVYVNPLARVLEQIYEPGALDLTGRSFEEIEQIIASGKPVILWNIASFEETDAMITWKTPEGKDIDATFQVHCVLLIGYDEDFVYVNNPFEEIQAQMVPKRSFLEAWDQMGRKALTYK